MLPHSREKGHGVQCEHTHFKGEIIPKQHNNDCEPSLLYFYTTISPLNHCFLLNIKYSMPQCSDVMSILHHSAICWWVTAPHAPNVKMPLMSQFFCRPCFQCFAHTIVSPNILISRRRHLSLVVVLLETVYFNQ